jgi:two-component system, cell cycle sensor histidine kinase and response regulator CckA
VELTIAAIESAGPLRFTGVIRDITARKQAEHALAESESAYRSTFDEAPVGVAHVAVDGPFLRVNARLSALLGYTRDELLAIDPLTLMETERVAERIKMRQQLLAGTIARNVGEVRFRMKNGRYLLTQVALSLHRDESGQPLYFIAIIEDISERRKLEEQLRQSQKMEAVGKLAGGIAHDFNNLLTAILGFSALTLDGLPEDDPARGHLIEIQQAGQSAAALTRQLLAFSRRQILRLEVIDLNAVVVRMDALLRRLIGEDVQLEHRLEPGLSRISADAGQIEQVILNLALNARDAMPRGGRLTIETKNLLLNEQQIGDRPMQSPGHYVMLAVSDTGVGMDADTQSQIFEPFFTTKKRGGGTGLGLSTVYGIVKQSGGWIWVYSEPGRGATFKLYFPLTTDPAGTTQLTVPPKTVRGYETILLAEDQPEVRSVAVAVLKRAGYHVLPAPSGQEALTIARTQVPIHLLLTDVIMPVMSGPELAKQIQAERPGIRVLFASGYTDDAVVRHGVLHDDVAFLQKPFTPQSLLEKVREVLDAEEPLPGGGPSPDARPS